MTPIFIKMALLFVSLHPANNNNPSPYPVTGYVTLSAPAQEVPATRPKKPVGPKQPLRAARLRHR